MANTFLLKIITPDHEVYNGEVEKVFLKNADGDFEVLANHARYDNKYYTLYCKI